MPGHTVGTGDAGMTGRRGGLWSRLRRRRAKGTERVTDVVPTGAYVFPLRLKAEYEAVPLHAYHPTPYNKITVLRRRERKHEWLCLGWYVDLYREQGTITGQIYRPLVTDQDKEVVLAAVKAQDKEANLRFGLT